MRCADLTFTWAQLTGWLERADVLVLPPLVAQLPLVRLDADTDGTPESTEVALTRLHRLIEHFGVRAVYVDRLRAPRAGAAAPELAVVTVRVLVAGAVHELRLFADWYVTLLDTDLGAEAVAPR
jgi:hypothetical protein